MFFTDISVPPDGSDSTLFMVQYEVESAQTCDSSPLIFYSSLSTFSEISTLVVILSFHFLCTTDAICLSYLLPHSEFGVGYIFPPIRVQTSALYFNDEDWIFLNKHFAIVAKSRKH